MSDDTLAETIKKILISSPFICGEDWNKKIFCLVPTIKMVFIDCVYKILYGQIGPIFWKLHS